MLLYYSKLAAEVDLKEFMETYNLSLVIREVEDTSFTVYIDKENTIKEIVKPTLEEALAELATMLSKMDEIQLYNEDRNSISVARIQHKRIFVSPETIRLITLKIQENTNYGLIS